MFISGVNVLILQQPGVQCQHAVMFVDSRGFVAE